MNSENKNRNKKRIGSALEAFRKANSPYRKAVETFKKDEDPNDSGNADDEIIGISPTKHYVNFDAEVHYWLLHFEANPLGVGLRSEDYEPAIKLGLDSYLRSGGRPLSEIRKNIQLRYQRTRGDSALTWKQAFAIIQDVWRRLA